MILNRLEFTVINNPLRSLIQRHFEARRMLQLGGRLHGGRALEAGCGPGFGTSLILKIFGADGVDAFDLDVRMVELTHARLCGANRPVRVWVGDATAIAVADNVYDAVFDFGIIHHIPDWRRALKEMHRVLKPGGRLYMEEVLARFIDHPIARRLFDHPRHDRFDAKQLVEATQDAGFTLQSERQLWGAFAWVTATK